MADKKSKNELTSLEIASFCSQLSLLLKSGVTVAEALSIIGQDLPDGEGRQLIAAACASTGAGGSLTQGLSAGEGWPRYLLDMVRIGEASGRLDECLDSLADYYEREDTVAKSIRSAVTYPLVMVAMMLVVVGVLVIKVLPIFQKIYQQLGAGASGFAAGFLQFGSALGSVALGLLCAVALLVVLYFVLRAIPAGRRLLAALSHRVVFTRRLGERIAGGRFASGMSMMLKSGLDAGEALEMVEKLVQGDPLAEKVAHCRRLVDEEGVALSEAVSRAGIFSGVYARMVAVGSRTGALDAVMAKIADRYEEETDALMTGILSVLEPTLVAVLSILVGMILLSVMLPLMGVMSSIG